MKLTIDNIDYSAALDADQPPRVIRRLNKPAEMSASLVGGATDLVVPAAGARVVLSRDSGEKLFTGYLASTPAHEYLGWGERGPAYRYTIHALSDESRLSSKLLPARGDFVRRSAGEILKTLASDAAPGVLDASACEDVSVVPSYWPDPRLRFEEHAAELALRARAAYRAHDGQLSLRPIGSTAHVIDESSADFCADGLKVRGGGDPVNDVTVSGAFGPGAYVKDYFCGDGYTLTFPLSETPFSRPGKILVEEEFRGHALRQEYWSVFDTTGAIAVSDGKLQVSGGAGSLGATFVRSVEQIELAGALALEHGEFEISGGADAIAGGLYNGNFEMAGCVAGFRLTPSAEATTQIAAVVNGTVAGQTITTAAGRRYALATHIYSGETYRLSERYETVAGGFGGNDIVSGARFVLQVHEIDPNDPASQVSDATVLYEGWLPDVPACCDYALINAASMQAGISYTLLARLADAEVRTCTPFGDWHNRLVGALSDGCECRVDGNSLHFFPAAAPEQGERILVTYRAAGRGVSRVLDEASIATLARVADDGHRSLVARIATPAARTSNDADQAAVALLRGQWERPWRGEYYAWDCFPGHDIQPGDEVQVRAPSRAAEFTAIVREVLIDVTDLLDDRCRVCVKFATESADPVALRLEDAPELQAPDRPGTLLTVGSEYSDAVTAAEIVDAGSTEVMIDAGADPVVGGGFEVRRSDSGWGLENDRNLIGRFDYRIFTVPRTSRSQTWFVRQFDGSVPVRYSRVSTILHLDHPL